MAETIGQKTELRLINSRNGPITFVLEPWGDVFNLDPGDDVLCLFGGSPGAPEVDFTDDSITVYGWSGSSVSVVINGAEAVAYNTPVPRIPDSMSMRGFADFMFKPQDGDKA